MGNKLSIKTLISSICGFFITKKRCSISLLQTNPSGKWLLLGLDDSFRSALGSGLLAGDFGTWLSGCLSRGLLGGSLHRLLLHNLLDGLDQSLALALQSLDDLLLFDEESADDSLSQAAVAQDTSVGPGDGLQTLGHPGTLAGPGGGDPVEFLLALTTAWHSGVLLHVLVHQTASGSAHTVNKWKILSYRGIYSISPATHMRLLLERVLYDRRRLRVKRWTILKLLNPIDHPE